MVALLSIAFQAHTERHRLRVRTEHRNLANNRTPPPSTTNNSTATRNCNRSMEDLSNSTELLSNSMERPSNSTATRNCNRWFKSVLFVFARMLRA